MTTPSRRLLAGLAAIAIVAGACGSAATPTPAATPADAGPAMTPAASQPTEIILMTHDSFAVTPALLDDFAAKTGITVRVLKAGDAGAALNQAILTKDKPVADVFFGVDSTFLSRAVGSGAFVPYQSAGLAHVDPAFQLDPTHALTPVDYGDVCINTDRKAYAATPPPATLRDLTAPPAEGSSWSRTRPPRRPGSPSSSPRSRPSARPGRTPGRTTGGTSGPTTCSSATAGRTPTTASSPAAPGKGERPLVVSYASSPVAEVFYADPQPAEAPTGVMTDGCFRQVEFAGILANGAHQAAAQRFIDFLLERPFQEEIPLQMFVFPVSSEAALPAVYQEHAIIPAAPLSIPAAEIAANRERWIEEWTQVVLR